MRLFFIFNWAFDENKTNRICIVYQSGILFCQINIFSKKLKTKKESYKVIVFSTISARALPGYLTGSNKRAALIHSEQNKYINRKIISSRFLDPGTF